MTRIFDITTTSDTLSVDAGGSGRLVFTVTNTTQKPQRGSLRAKALDSAQAGWLTVGGEAERDFPAGFTHQVDLNVKVPAGTPPGKFRVRLDALSVANPDDDFTEGPAVGVTISAGAAPPPKQSLWWLWVLIGVLLVAIIGVVVYLAMRKPGPPGPETPASAPSQPASSAPPPPPPPPVTREFNDPRIQVSEGALPLDICREWGVNCGKPAADAFCRSKGLAAASDFRVAQDSPPTVVISSKQVCREQACDRITWVACTSERYGRLTLSAQTLQSMRAIRLKGKEVPDLPDAASAP